MILIPPCQSENDNFFALFYCGNPGRRITLMNFTHKMKDKPNHKLRGKHMAG